MGNVNRQTIDLSGYPDLVVIYLGMRVNALTGLKTVFGFGPKIADSAASKPDGLLLHENLLWGLFPPHVGMRQYWATLNRWRLGRGLNHTGRGGPLFCEIPEVPGSGMILTRGAACINLKTAVG